MSENNTCPCGSAPKLLFPCSGGSDVGELTDRAARKLTKAGAGKMYCLAGIGGRVSGIMATTQSAAKLLTIDGCPQCCAQRTLLEAGFKECAHLQLAELGLAKGNAPVTAERINQVVQAGIPLLAC